MSVSTSSVDPRSVHLRQQKRVFPGDRGRPLTRTRGLGRAGRLAATALVVLWFALPLLPLALWSFADRWSFPDVLPEQFGFQGLTSALRDGAGTAFLLSLALAGVVAAIATPLGALAAKALARGRVKRERLVTALLFSPVILPPFAAIFGINLLLLRAWVPPLVGVILVLVATAIPYTTFSMRLAYAAYDDGYDEEARTLGAGRRTVLWRVHLPLIAPALARTAFLAFLVGWSDYLVTLIVGGGGVVTLPIIIASRSAGIGNEASVALLSLSAILPPLILLWLIARARNTTSRRIR